MPSSLRSPKRFSLNEVQLENENEMLLKKQAELNELRATVIAKKMQHQQKMQTELDKMEAQLETASQQLGNNPTEKELINLKKNRELIEKERDELAEVQEKTHACMKQ